MKKAIVIGATSGIGREIAILLAKDNYKVGVTGRRVELLNEFAKENPDRFYPREIDINNTSNSIETLNQLATEMGGVDLLILSSGTGDINEELDFQIEKRTIETNVLGFTAITNWAFNLFKKQGYGHLAGITSVAGLRGNRSAPAYNATKAYQINYLEGIRQKAKNLHLPIHITDIRPGFVDTQMAKGDGLFWVASPQKAAKQILWAIRKNKRVAYVTRRWALIAILLKILPRFIYDRL
jgi:short-subunit dehydrogenase